MQFITQRNVTKSRRQVFYPPGNLHQSNMITVKRTLWVTLKVFSVLWQMIVAVDKTQLVCIKNHCSALWYY